MDLYQIEQLSFSFPDSESDALKSISLSIKNGEFIVICGQSGSGKSTLLRQLKPVLSPHGKRRGTIYYRSKPVQEWDTRTQTAEIGFVQQNAENGIVTDKVWHELAFGLESLGFDNAVIRLRVAEMASFFGIQHWFHKGVTELSGGQKQLLNLASIMTMHPSILILDEPTSQLDPIAAAEFLASLKKINQELGTTIVITEHRLEEVLPLADRLLVMDNGCLLIDDPPIKAGQSLFELAHPLFASMPAAMQIKASIEKSGALPITVKEGRQWLEYFATGKERKEAATLPKQSEQSHGEAVIVFKEVWFKYNQSGPDVIKDLTFSVRKGEFYCIVGGNGVGKTSALSLISGIHKPYRGEIWLSGKKSTAWSTKDKYTKHLGILPQNPQTLFVKKTVELDLYEMLQGSAITKEQKQEKVMEIVRFAELEKLLNRHPYDLSGGEQQRAALAKVLLLEPVILLLDEPTKGLDGYFKQKLAQLLTGLNKRGVTIVMVSHDIEFCAQYGQTCAMFFDGKLITANAAKSFFAGNSYYTTAANRMARHIWKDAVTAEDVISRCQSLR